MGWSTSARLKLKERAGFLPASLLVAFLGGVLLVSFLGSEEFVQEKILKVCWGSGGKSAAESPGSDEGHRAKGRDEHRGERRWGQAKNECVQRFRQSLGAGESIPNGICFLSDRLASVESKGQGVGTEKTDEDSEALRKWMGKAPKVVTWKDCCAVLRARLQQGLMPLRWSQTGWWFPLKIWVGEDPRKGGTKERKRKRPCGEAGPGELAGGDRVSGKAQEDRAQVGCEGGFGREGEFSASFLSLRVNILRI